jgi:cytidine deaminase
LAHYKLSLLHSRTALDRFTMNDRSAESARELYMAAKAAMARAYAPFSGSPVGAAIRAASGAVYSGCNVENVSYPEGWCAETSAIAQMVLAGDRAIAEVAVVAERMDRITPCGGCRQRILEFGSDETLIHLCDATGVVETVTLGALLPRAFALEDQ